jgi:hypothetical protein
MANIKLKSINELHTWNTKELRKLRMTIKNRMSSLESSSEPKELSQTHPLFDMGESECKELLDRVLKEEKNN